MIARWFHRIEMLSIGAKTLVLAALFSSIAATDLATGLDVTLRALYLLPVGLAAWLLGPWAAVVVSLLSVGVSSYFDVALGLSRTHADFVYSDAIVRLAVYFAATWILVRLRTTQARLNDLTETDPLTGLLNRRGFQRLAQRELERSRRTGSNLTVVAIDLDGFKGLNDARGHAEGDAVLIGVAHALRLGRATDIAARVGGDEFALVLPEVAADRAAQAVSRLVATLDAAMAQGAWSITFSVGVATFCAPREPLEALLLVADELMYEVKRGGKAGVRRRDVGQTRVA